MSCFQSSAFFSVFAFWFCCCTASQTCPSGLHPSSCSSLPFISLSSPSSSSFLTFCWSSSQYKTVSCTELIFCSTLIDCSILVLTFFPCYYVRPCSHRGSVNMSFIVWQPSVFCVNRFLFSSISSSFIPLHLSISALWVVCVLVSAPPPLSLIFWNFHFWPLSKRTIFLSQRAGTHTCTANSDVHISVSSNLCFFDSWVT